MCTEKALPGNIPQGNFILLAYQYKLEVIFVVIIGDVAIF